MNNNNKKEEKKQDEIIVKCTEKKKKNPKFSNYISEFLSKSGQERVSTCGDFIMLLSDLKLEN
ncbi:replication protein, partial [Clostridium perfringens]